MVDNQIIDAQIIEKELVGVTFAETEIITVQLNTIDIVPYKKKLSTLDDVNIPSPSDGEVLTYKEVTETWESEPLSETELLKIIPNETPTNVNPLPSKRFRTANAFVTGKLKVYLNGQKIHTSEITIHSSTEFSFPINIITSDKIECSYIKQ